VCPSVHLSVYLSICIFHIKNYWIEFVDILYLRNAIGRQSIFAISDILHSIRSMRAEVSTFEEEGEALMLLPKYNDLGNRR
jgi:hypothetical protein